MLVAVVCKWSGLRALSTRTLGAAKPRKRRVPVPRPEPPRHPLRPELPVATCSTLSLVCICLHTAQFGDTIQSTAPIELKTRDHTYYEYVY